MEDQLNQAALLNEDQLAQQNIQQNEQVEQIPQNEERRMTQLFKQSLQQFQVIKCTVPWTFIFFQGEGCTFGQAEYCIIGFAILAFLSFFYYFKLYQIGKNDNFMLDIAENMHHVFYTDPNFVQQELIEILQEQGYSEEQIQQELLNYQEPQEYNNNNQPYNTEEQNKKISLLTQQIKLEIKKKDKFSMLLGSGCFLVFQGLLIWATVQYFYFQYYNYWSYNESTNIGVCHKGSIIYLFLMLIFGFYQYMDYYLIVMVACICLPFVLIYLIYSGIKRLITKKKRSDFSQKIKGVKFSKNLINSDPECSICMASYENSDKIVVLPCQGKHHFHEECIKSWLKVTLNCPNCRQDLNSIDSINNNNNNQNNNLQQNYGQINI